MDRPGRYGENPDADRPRVRLFGWSAFTVYGLIGVVLMLKWFLFVYL